MSVSLFNILIGLVMTLQIAYFGESFVWWWINILQVLSASSLIIGLIGLTDVIDNSVKAVETTIKPKYTKTETPLC